MSSIDEGLFLDFEIIAETSSSRKVKIYKERIDPFTKYDENEFFGHYRFTKQNARFIIEAVSDDLASRSNRGGALSPELIVLVSLRYLGKGSYQSDTGDLHNISQQSVSNCVRKFVTALASKKEHLSGFQQTLEAFKE
ncbi:uncharacterized protein LOC129939974 isoform X2 [Eupeodes corollae]|uniref:uncharacterized protein LOC129939974 isoform X2 n=1 Tax=Eupeodes corollae TaxID=290404 RepID=UPI00249173E0|nr:uncharacterized protein LOC129939974 isoform X2 [Eupeodes corollae]